MSLSVLQLRDANGVRHVAATDDQGITRRVNGIASTYELAQAAIQAGISLTLAVATSMLCSDVPVMCMCIFLEPRRYHSRRALKYKPMMCLKFRRRRFACHYATRSAKQRPTQLRFAIYSCSCAR